MEFKNFRGYIQLRKCFFKTLLVLDCYVRSYFVQKLLRNDFSDNLLHKLLEKKKF